MASSIAASAAIISTIRSGSFGIFRNMRIATSVIRMPTATRIPLKALATQAISRNRSRNREIRKMMTKDGSTTPSVAAIAPGSPFCLYPTKVAQLIAMGPGVDSAITVTFARSSWVIHCFRVTQVCSITDSMAYPPPKVNSPIFAYRSPSFIRISSRGKSGMSCSYLPQ